MRPNILFVRTKFWTDGGSDAIARYANFCTNFLSPTNRYKFSYLQPELPYQYCRTKSRTTFRKYSTGGRTALRTNLFVVGVGDVDVAVVVTI